MIVKAQRYTSDSNAGDTLLVFNQSRSFCIEVKTDTEWLLRMGGESKGYFSAVFHDGKVQIMGKLTGLDW